MSITKKPLSFTTFGDLISKEDYKKLTTAFGGTVTQTKSGLRGDDSYLNWISDQSDALKATMLSFQSQIENFESSSISNTGIGVLPVPVFLSGWYNKQLKWENRDPHYIGYLCNFQTFLFPALIGKYSLLKQFMGDDKLIHFPPLSESRVGDTFSTRSLIKQPEDLSLLEDDLDDLIPINKPEYYKLYKHKNIVYVIAPLIPMSYFKMVLRDNFNTKNWGLIF